ncbi:MAG: hypothetical protein EPO26_18180 [Chloroflexota bacterium]|nr:MAG: hypothetical protein EPO26_18180 [Chloroflexota bacterium]
MRTENTVFLNRALIALVAIVAALLALPLAIGRAADGDIRPGSQIIIRDGGPGPPSSIAAPFVRGAQAATFIVNYDAGFQANASARAAFQYAVDIWATQVTSSVPIVVTASFTALSSGVLGSAGADQLRRDFPNAPRANTWYPVALANKLRGADSDTTVGDITAQFSSAANWYYGLDGQTPSNQTDFVSVVLHELGHGLGFSGSGSISGSTASIGSSGFMEAYDYFVVTGSGVAVTTLSGNSAALSSAYQGGSLFWNGANAVAAAGGANPRMYAPSPWEDGSSYSHLDETTYAAGNANSLMTPAISRGEAIHSPGAITLGIFADLGWTAASSATATRTATSSPTATRTSTPSPIATIALSGPVPTWPSRALLPVSPRNNAP